MLRDGKVPALAFYVGAEGRTFVRHPVVVNLPEMELHCRVYSIRVVAVSGAILRHSHVVLRCLLPNGQPRPELRQYVHRIGGGTRIHLPRLQDRRLWAVSELSRRLVTE